MSRFVTLRGLLAALLVSLSAGTLRAEERILLANGFELSCARHEAQTETGRVRIYPVGGTTEYFEVAATSIRTVETLEAPVISQSVAIPVQAGIPGLLAEAGARHHIDVDLLASLVNAESGGHPMAVSRAGAKGLMQLMPGTAASLGVKDAFRPEQNIAGGTAYLDQLLTRFHDDLALALAAYNAGPGAVERWHGIPPYRETRAYVARIVTEYNRRKKAALVATR